MATFQRTTADQLAEVGGSIATRYTAANIKLLKAAIPLSPNMVVADCVAQEADFSGYVPVVYAGPPVPYPDLVQGGVSFTIPTANFVVGAAPAILNNIYGAWIETTANVLIMAILFSAYVPMQAAADQINLEMSLNYFGAGGVLVTVNGALV